MRTIMMICLMLVAGFTVQAQSYSVNKAGELVEVKKTETTKAKVEDKVYKTIGSHTFYTGAKGGIYEWKTSKKTGLKYKAYIPKEK